jgi:hypothetical protein
MLHLAGRANAKDVRRRLRGDETLPTWLIRFHLVEGPDPRDELANAADLSPADVEELTSKLTHLDSFKETPWTLATLRLIQANPATRAADLAGQVDRDTPGFKIDVRKLKNLGLTHSLEVGYELTPRGAAYLKALDK